MEHPPAANASPARGASTLRRISITVAGNAFAPLSALAVAPMLARGLGVDGRGEVAAAMGPFWLLLAAGALGIPEALTYAYAKRLTDKRRALLRALAWSSLAGAGFAGAAMLAAGWLSEGNDDVRTLIWVAAVATVPALAVSVLRGAAAGLHAWRAVAVERGVVATVRFVGIGGLYVTSQLTPMNAVLVLAFAPIVGAVAYAGVTRIARAADATHYEPFSLGSYGARVWIGSLAGVLLMRLDQAILNPLSGTYELGLYAVGVALSEVPLVITSAVREVMFSSEAERSEDQRLVLVARLSTLVSVGVAALVAILVPWGLPFLFGEEFSGAIPVTFVLLAAVAFGPAGSIAGAGLSGRGHPGLRSSALIGGLLINVVMLVALAPTLGAMGAAWATLGGNLVSTNLNMWLLARRSAIRYRDLVGIRASDIARARQEVRSIVARRRGEVA